MRVHHVSDTVPVRDDIEKRGGGCDLSFDGNQRIGFVAVGVAEQLEKRRDPAFVDDDLLVPVVVFGQRSELESRVGSILRLTHVKHSGVGPNPRQNRVVARYRRQGKVGSVVGIVDREQPLHVANGRLEKVRDLAEVGRGGDREHLPKHAAVLAFSNQG